MFLEYSLTLLFLQVAVKYKDEKNGVLFYWPIYCFYWPKHVNNFILKIFVNENVSSYHDSLLWVVTRAMICSI